MPNLPLTYELRPLDPPRDMRTSAVMTCAKCSAKGKIPIMSMGNNPEKIIKGFIRLGWSADQHKHALCICPKCVKERTLRAEKVAERKDAEAKEVKMPAPQPFVRQVQPSLRVSGMADLTKELKLKLRQELDASFDDDTGRFLEGVTDHTISESTGIPRAVVVEFRELVYGKLSEDPEITALRTEISNCKTVLSGLQSSINKMELKLDEIAKKNGLR